MWKKLGEWILRNRLVLLIMLAIVTVIMGWFASKVELSYDFARAIPVDNPKYKEYLSFKEKFGEDGNLMTIGFQDKDIFRLDFFNKLLDLHYDLKNTEGVDDVISVATAINLVKNDSTEKLVPKQIFPRKINSQQELDSLRAVFYNLPFFKGLMYNPETGAWLLGVRVNRNILNSKKRDQIIPVISEMAMNFGKANKTEIHLSGLPLIRSNLAVRISNEMRYFLIGSILLSAVILWLFFRSFSTTLLSLAVVLIGVACSLATMHLFGFRITLLNALIPPLVVVIGIPNCIYFLNKYHTSYLVKENKFEALTDMVSKMGIVTLFCNIAAAIGFAVFALTKSAILKEFGIVAGINIMVIFFISIILLPAALSYLPAPKAKHLNYLENRWLSGILTRIEKWVFSHKNFVYAVTIGVVAFSVAGIFKLKAQGFIVDDLPKTDVIYSDLKFFEKNFKGIMPLEILIDTKKKNGFAGMRALQVFDKIDSFSREIAASPDMARPLSLVEGLKFAKQGFYDGDSNNYVMPNSFDGAFVADYLRVRKDTSSSASSFQKLMAAFMDSNRQVTRVSVNMADIGSKRLPLLIDTLKKRADHYFDSTQYKVTFTGTSITFLEGSRFIINGLRDSIFWAFLLISLCMLYLFRSFRILICSLIPNLIPLALTAGVMGWAGIALKPSTVLVFSVALGIAIDVTIRFLVNYKQELPHYDNNVEETVLQTLRSTGISIIYTSLVLIAGFVIFMFSGFGGTQALGMLTSLTLLAATLTNLILLPVLLLSTSKNKK
jgi:predicted RND superfamily exporter protein